MSLSLIIQYNVHEAAIFCILTSMITTILPCEDYGDP
jgi:hypothetical protein